MTRRIVKPTVPGGCAYATIEDNGAVFWWNDEDGRIGATRTPWLVGLRLWVKERWCSYREDTTEQAAEKKAARDAFFAAPSLEGIQAFTDLPRSSGEEKFLYAADFGEWADDPEADFHWQNTMFMPRRASRITLEITGVRMEKLNDISEEDAIAEGVRPGNGTPENGFDTEAKFPATAAYAGLWDSIHGDGSWATSPWVWVLTFKRMDP